MPLMSTRQDSQDAQLANLLWAAGAIDRPEELPLCLSRLESAPEHRTLRAAAASAPHYDGSDPSRLLSHLLTTQPALCKALVCFGVSERREALVERLLAAGVDARQEFCTLTLLQLLAASAPKPPYGRTDVGADVRLARKLVAAGCPLTARHGVPPLALALHRGRLQLADALLDLGAAVEAGDPYHLLFVLGDHCTADPSGSGDCTHLARRLAAAGARLGLSDAGEPLVMHLVHRALLAGLAHPAPLDLVECLLELGAAAGPGPNMPLPHLLCAGLGSARNDPALFRRLLRLLVAAGQGLNQVVPELHHALPPFITAAVFANVANAPALLRVLLEEGASVAAASQDYPSPLDILVDRLASRDLTSDGFALPECAPELVRILADAGCRADHSFPDGDDGELTCPPVVSWVSELVEREGHLGPGVALNALELGVFEALLEATAREHAACGAALAAASATQQEEHERLRQERQQQECTAATLAEMAAGVGDLPLLRLVLRVLPHAVRASEARSPWSPCERRRRVGSERAEGTLLMILWRLQTQLNDTPLPLEAQGQLPDWCGRAVLSFCALAQALLEAGAAPIPLEPTLLAGACDPPVPGIVSVMPCWAHEPLSFLPVVVAGVAWSPEHHAAFPPAFQLAAQTMLLINHTRGFGGSSSSGRAESSGQQQGKEAAPSAPGERGGRQRGPLPAPATARGKLRLRAAATEQARPSQQPGVELPQDVLFRILRETAGPVLEWVPELRPFLGRWREEEL